LTRDIDFQSVPFIPIGSQSGVFNGILDGRGFSIRGLKIESDLNSSYTGMFSQLGKDAIIANLQLEDMFISGGFRVGSIAGRNSGGAVLNCLVGSRDNPVIIRGCSDTGGIIGHNFKGLVADSRVYANVTSYGLAGITFGTNHEGSLVNFVGEGVVVGYLEIGKLAGINQAGDIINIRIRVDAKDKKGSVNKMMSGDYGGIPNNPSQLLTNFFKEYN